MNAFSPISVWISSIWALAFILSFYHIIANTANNTESRVMPQSIIPTFHIVHCIDCVGQFTFRHYIKLRYATFPVLL